jgi:hypothetical protein
MPKKYLGLKKFSQRTLRRKDIKEYEDYKKRFLNALHSKKNLAALRSLREIYYSYSSVTYLFDIAVLEKYLG